MSIIFLTYKTCQFLISFIRDNAPEITGVWKMKKAELIDNYLKILKSRDEEGKAEPVKKEPIKAELK